LYYEVDDCYLKTIDNVSLKRFLTKCCLGSIIKDNLIIAIIRRWDLNADAKLSKLEFIEAITPIEPFTRQIT